MARTRPDRRRKPKETPPDSGGVSVRRHLRLLPQNLFLASSPALLQQPVSLRQPKALLLAATLSKVSRAHHNYKTAFLEAHGSSQPGGKSCAIYKLCTKTSTWMFGQQNVQALPLRSVFYSSCQKCLIFCLAHTYSQGWRELLSVYIPALL